MVVIKMKETTIKNILVFLDRATTKGIQENQAYNECVRELGLLLPKESLQEAKVEEPSKLGESKENSGTTKEK